jgi:hypothetical protein
MAPLESGAWDDAARLRRAATRNIYVGLIAHAMLDSFYIIFGAAFILACAERQLPEDWNVSFTVRNPYRNAVSRS